MDSVPSNLEKKYHTIAKIFLVWPAKNTKAKASYHVLPKRNSILIDYIESSASD